MNISYSSTGQNPFETWKVVFIAVITAIVVFYLISLSFVLSLVFILLIAFTIGTLMTTRKVSDIQRLDDVINFSDDKQYDSIHNLKAIETWWCYDMAGATSVLNMGSTGQTRGHANKINIYAKFISDEKAVILCEQIHLSDKFPHNHDYKYDTSTGDDHVYKVWNVDKCIQKLQLSDFVIPPSDDKLVSIGRPSMS